uniref:Vipericidin n=1 Tax=Naja naja TaxID=35670 RepID=A0A8C6XWC8_NAJNA
MAKEPTMEGIFWKTLLVVGALSASGHCAPSQKVLTYAEAVEQGVVNYNKKAKEDSLYRLLEAVPRPGWDTNSKGTQELNFTIKETVCPAKEEASLDKCDFKEGGVNGFTLSMFLFLYRWSENAQPPISFGRRHLWKKRGEGEEEPGGGGGKKVVWCLGLLVMSSKPRREVEPLAK